MEGFQIYLKNIGTLATDKKQPQDKETGQMSRGLT